MIVAGFGFRGGASADSLADALARACGPRPAALATLDDKARSPAFSEFAARLGLPVIAVTEEAAQDVDTLTSSTASQSARGVGSVAEASALAAAGPGARLVAPRVISADRDATCALAEGTAP